LTRIARLNSALRRKIRDLELRGLHVELLRRTVGLSVRQEGFVPRRELLVVVINGQSPVAGYHAELVHRFGRPEPLARVPVLSPRPVTIGGHALGRPVAMAPPLR
jgi:hypothetical protein